MTCDCKTRIEQDLAERLMSKVPDARDVVVTLEGYALTLTGGERPCMMAKVSARRVDGIKPRPVASQHLFQLLPILRQVHRLTRLSGWGLAPYNPFPLVS